MNCQKQKWALFNSTPQFVFAALFVLLIYLSLASASSLTKRPLEDEAGISNAAYNLAFHGQLGGTVYQLGGSRPPSVAQHVYWLPPLHFVTTAAWFKAFGFGVFRARLLSILWGFVALLAWYPIFRVTSASRGESLVATAFVSLDYFFLLAASDGRMDMMCNALGTAGIAVYLCYREKNLTAAMVGANVLVVASGLTHPVGIIYFFGLLFLAFYFDRKRLSWRLLMLATLPYLVGALLWGSYILQDPSAFRAQFFGNMELNRQAAGITKGFNPVSVFEREIARRYIAPFGLGPGVPLLNRTKGIVLIAYCCGLLAIALVRKLRRNRYLLALLMLTLIYFVVLAFVSPSKYFYYLPHTTMPMAACLALALLQLGRSGNRRPIAWVILAGVAAIQLAGTLYRIRQDPYHRSYFPVIRVIEQNSNQGGLVVGEAGLWYGLTPNRTLLHDSSLGCFGRLRPDLIVMDPLFQFLLENNRLAFPEGYECEVKVLQNAREIYRNDYYTVYKPDR